MDLRIKRLIGCFLGVVWIVVSPVVFADGGSPQPPGQQETVECYVGQYTARIVPERIRVFSAPSGGMLTHINKEIDGRVPKGAVIARLNEKDIELERQELDVALLKNKIEKEEEVNNLIREKEELEFLLNLPVNERRLAKSSGAEKRLDKRLLKTMDDKIELAKAEVETIGGKKKSEFEKREEAHYFTMPFEGRLQYSFSVKDLQEEEVYVEASKDIATVYDDSAFYLMIQISSPEISRLPPESFRLSAELGNGNIITGKFSHKKIEKSSQSNPQNAEIWVYYFKIDQAGDFRQFEKMLAVNYVGKLHYIGDDHVISISKMVLANLPEAKSTSSWQKLLEAVKPGYELVLIGETQIIARKK